METIHEDTEDDDEASGLGEPVRGMKLEDLQAKIATSDEEHETAEETDEGDDIPVEE